MTTNHDYNTPRKGATDWDEPLNENFELFDVDVEVRDTDANRGRYDPLQGAKFFASDTGAIYLGDGDQWLRVAATGSDPTFGTITLDGEVTTTGQPVVLSPDDRSAFRVTPHRTESPAEGYEMTAPNVVAGHEANEVAGDVVGAIIAGGGMGWVGGGQEERRPNRVEGHIATISGGYDNTAVGNGCTIGGGARNVAGDEDVESSTIGGGIDNEASGNGATVGGGWGNKTSGDDATIAGGGSNTASGEAATVSGGMYNDAAGEHAAIDGGRWNSATAAFAAVGGGKRNESSGEYATVAGGEDNQATGGGASAGGGSSNEASGRFSVVPGGLNNDASGEFATVGGGNANEASGKYAVVPGGLHNDATAPSSFAAGEGANARHANAFVWNDGETDSFDSTDAEQFLVNARGGVGLGTNSPETPLDVAGENNWNLDSNEGDLRVGNDDYRLCIGVSLGGVGRGTVRLRAKGVDDTPQLKLGAGDTDTATITDSAVKPANGGGPSLGTSSDQWSHVYAQSGTVSTSDERLKTDVTDVADGLDAVRALRPVAYEWTDADDAPDDDGRRLGFLAQEVADVVPEAVEEPADDDGYYGLNYDELVPVLTAAVQEQQDAIENQADTIEDQTDTIEAQRETVETLEDNVADLREELTEMKRLLADAGVA